MAEFIPHWCTTEQACRLLGVHEATLRQHRGRVGGALQYGTF